jgi:adenine-specific DNA-methyltransferase
MPRSITHRATGPANHRPSRLENPAYLRSQLITCLGNKRSLLGPIEAAIERVKHRLRKDRLACFDVFSGSGVVSRLMKAHASLVVTNDLEDYATVVSRCHLANRGDVDMALLAALVDDLNDRVGREDAPAGFIADLYAPRDDANIGPEDRVFYTCRNARRLDAYRQLIGAAPAGCRDLLLGPLLSAASIHANTAGVFKGFYKNRRTGVGQFGGSGTDSLRRILGEIRLEVPVLSDFECPVVVLQAEAATAAAQSPPVDLAYIDPPYNQHPYGSNYFLLNLLVRYERPTRISRVSGIPDDWNRSGYNVRAEALPLFRRLVSLIDAPYLLVSYNNEGFITPLEMRDCLAAFGTVEVVEIPYNTFRGSRSLRQRPLHVTEHLFLVERQAARGRGACGP